MSTGSSVEYLIFCVSPEQAREAACSVRSTLAPTAAAGATATPHWSATSSWESATTEAASTRSTTAESWRPATTGLSLQGSHEHLPLHLLNRRRTGRRGPRSA